MGKFGSVLIVCALLLMPTCVSAQWGSSGTKLVASGSAGNTAVAQRTFFVYKPVKVTETVTTTTDPTSMFVWRQSSRVERAPMIVSPRLQRAIARRAARTERATVQTRAIAIE